MKETKQAQFCTQVLETNIGCMRKLLEKCLLAVVEAEQRIQEKERNGAIGAMLDLEPMLQNTKALFDATLYLHRNEK